MTMHASVQERMIAYSLRIQDLSQAYGTYSNVLAEFLKRRRTLVQNVVV